MKLGCLVEKITKTMLTFKDYSFSIENTREDSRTLEPSPERAEHSRVTSHILVTDLNT